MGGALERRPEVRLLRELAPRVLAAVVRRYGDFAAAEDAVQEALLAAAVRWPAVGVPADPGAWLYRVAARRVVDHVRSEHARRRREGLAAEADPSAPGWVAPPDVALGGADDTLALLFLCCHPALTRPTAIALTLRAVAGLTTAEIARAFLVPEATMGQRISRAKRTIRDSGVGFGVVGPEERSERLGAVCHVLYLVFNEGYAASEGEGLERVDLAREALRLMRQVRALAPEDGEVGGLLALMLLTHARRAARSGPEGQLIPLDEQDRALWDRALIAEGLEVLERAMAGGAIGSYQLQAAIAATHGRAARFEDTDWAQILALYELLLRIADGPAVRLNHAVAASMVRGPAYGLELLERLEADPRLARQHRLDAVRAHLLERSGDRAGALAAFRRAAARTTSLPERDYLLARAVRLVEEGG